MPVVDKSNNSANFSLLSKGFASPLLTLLVFFSITIVTIVASIADRSNEAIKVMENPNLTILKNKIQIHNVITVIKAFMLRNGRMPCPADPSINSGVEQCSFSTSTCGAANSIIKKGRILIGNIPYQTLGISKDIASDIWGEPLRYIVYDSLTENGVRVIRDNGIVNIESRSNTRLIADNQLIKISNYDNSKAVDNFNIVGVVLSKYGSNESALRSNKKESITKDNFLIDSRGGEHRIWLNQNTNTADCNGNIGSRSGVINSFPSPPIGTLSSANSLDGIGLIAISPISSSTLANNITFVENVVFIDDKGDNDTSKIINCPIINNPGSADGYANWPVTLGKSLAIYDNCLNGYVPHSGYTNTVPATLYRYCTTNGFWEDNVRFNSIKTNARINNGTIRSCYLPCLASPSSPVVSGRTQVIDNSYFISEVLTLTDSGSSNARIRCRTIMPGELLISASTAAPSIATCNPGSPATNPLINGSWSVIDNCKVLSCLPGYSISPPYNICCPTGQSSTSNTSCGDSVNNKKSCYEILAAGESLGSGVYTIDPDGTGTGTGPLKAYCDMDITHGGGGWTLVAAQYDDSPISEWNQGVDSATFVPPTFNMLNSCGNSISSTNGCNLSNSNGFVFSSNQLPIDRGQVSFGKGSDATFVGYSNYVYTTGDISNGGSCLGAGITVLNLKDNINYQIHRNGAGFYIAHNPEGASQCYTSLHTNVYSDTLTYDKTGGEFNSWAFAARQFPGKQPGYSMLGYTGNALNDFAWTVWVRPYINTTKRSCKDILDSGLSVGNGEYIIDPDGDNITAGSFKVYCDMSTDGGGWTLVVAQYEDSPVLHWGQGINEQTFEAPTPTMLDKCGNSTVPGNGCNLPNSNGFVLSQYQLPIDRTQTAFGMGSNPTYIGYGNFVYTTEDIPITNIFNQKYSNTLQIYRTRGKGCNNHDPEKKCDVVFTKKFAYINGGIIVDKTGGWFWNYLFYPYGTQEQRGSALNPNLAPIPPDRPPSTEFSREKYAWTIWVR